MIKQFVWGTAFCCGLIGCGSGSRPLKIVLPAASPEKFVERPNEKAPKVVEIQYRDPQVQDRLIFVDVSENAFLPKMTRDISEWFIDTQDLEKSKQPYFEVKLEDEDTPTEQLKLFYKISSRKEDDLQMMNELMTNVGKSKKRIYLYDKTLQDALGEGVFGVQHLYLNLDVKDGRYHNRLQIPFDIETLPPKIHPIYDPILPDSLKLQDLSEVTEEAGAHPLMASLTSSTSSRAVTKILLFNETIHPILIKMYSAADLQYKFIQKNHFDLGESRGIRYETTHTMNFKGITHQVYRVHASATEEGEYLVTDASAVPADASSPYQAEFIYEMKAKAPDAGYPGRPFEGLLFVFSNNFELDGEAYAGSQDPSLEYNCFVHEFSWLGDISFRVTSKKFAETIKNNSLLASVAQWKQFLSLNDVKNKLKGLKISVGKPTSANE
ncbi:MAG: hypothetical protein HY390_00070 [Deltaproteobacteria bacterium]|nr:hypothetical protein [Deltaproteobacteria bacterium]